MLGTVCLLALAGAALAPPVRGRVVTTTNDSAQAAEPTPTPLPHQRFPHAVLYGGNCGGTIIGDKWILTAGHCSRETNHRRGKTILAGTSNYLQGTGISIRVKKRYLHPLFSVGPFWVNTRQFGMKQVAARWDFMLAELVSPLPLDGVNMAAVALDGEPAVPANLSVSFAGYGAEQFNHYMREDMQIKELRTLSDAECAKLEQYNAEDMVCAVGRNESKDFSCNGDSGSGLVTDGPGPRRLIGVVSWAEDDAHECRPGATAVFGRVAAARPWIKQITGI